MKVKIKNYGIIHAVAYCSDCDWEECYYTKASKAGYEHAKQTGHEVRVETGSSRVYSPKNDEKHRLPTVGTVVRNRGGI